MQSLIRLAAATVLLLGSLSAWARRQKVRAGEVTARPHRWKRLAR